ncbi:MAG: hypothetical protein AAB377_01365 [Patescibacteria group bacterium]
MFNKIVTVVFAADPPIKSITDVENTLVKIVNLMFGIFWIIAVVVIIWAAFTFLTAGDDKEKVEKAKKILLYALIAATVALLANSIGPVLSNLLGGIS